jgi:hypothetical protein
MRYRPFSRQQWTGMMGTPATRAIHAGEVLKLTCPPQKSTATR